jgi:dihydroflavonol-4-reductase
MATTVLVSGATGFIASHAIERLLAKGYKVVGTVRDASDTKKNAHLLHMKGATDRLKLVSANLNDADPFSAHADVDAILHMASPYSLRITDPQRDLVDPAVNGTLSMMRAAAANPRLKRVVLTSSMAAITDEPDGRVLTEADWNTQSTLKRNPYYLSKTLAERAAWDFMKEKKPHFDLVVINPFLVTGPCHTSAVNTSNETFVGLAKGAYPAVMALNWGFVDVRDVADTHIAAIENKNASGRYICASGNMDMAEVVALMRAQGYGHTKIPKFNLTGAFGTKLMKLASYAQPVGIGSYLRTHLGRVPRFSNEKAVQELGIHFMSPQQTVKDTLADLSRWGHIPSPKL